MALPVSMFYGELVRTKTIGSYMLNSGELIIDNLYGMSVCVFVSMSKRQVAVVKFAFGQWDVAEL